MEKIKIEPFVEVINYLTWQSQAPIVFARIIQLETKFNELIDHIHGQSKTADIPPRAKSAQPPVKSVNVEPGDAGNALGSSPATPGSAANDSTVTEASFRTGQNTKYKPHSA